MTLQELAAKIIKYTKTIETLQEKLEILKQTFKNQTSPGKIIYINGKAVEHALIKRTITDPNELTKIGIDPNKVTVTVTKIDPVLVKEIGEKENKKYYWEESRIIVKNVKNK